VLLFAHAVPVEGKAFSKELVRSCADNVSDMTTGVTDSATLTGVTVSF